MSFNQFLKKTIGGGYQLAYNLASNVSQATKEAKEAFGDSIVAEPVKLLAEGAEVFKKVVQNPNVVRAVSAYTGRDPEKVYQELPLMLQKEGKEGIIQRTKIGRLIDASTRRAPKGKVEKVGKKLKKTEDVVRQGRNIIEELSQLIG